MKSSFVMYVNKDAVLENIKYLKALKNKDILPVLKSNAYGHGIKEMAKLLHDNGIQNVVVARYREALEILKIRPEVPNLKILVLESIEDFKEVKDDSSIEIAINTLEDFNEAIKYGIPTTRMHIKVDLNFARNGLTKDIILKLKDYTDKNDLYFKGIFSHLFAVGYERGLEMIETFSNYVDLIGRDRFEAIHLQNAASIYNHDIEIATHLRTGMLVYGLQDPGYFDFNLKQAFTLKGKIDTIKSITLTDYIAYEKKEDIGMKDDIVVGKIKIGYGDGFLKINEGTKCLINNKEYRIAQVTMDNSFIEIDSRVKEGDEVQLFYNYHTAKQSIGLDIQEILTILTSRIERKYY